MRRQYLLIAWVLGFGCASPPAPSSPPPSTAAAPEVPITPTPTPTSTSTTSPTPTPPTTAAIKIPITLGWRRLTPSGIDLFQKLQSGEIRLGMTREEIVRVLEHDPTSTETDSDGDWHFHAMVNGLRGDWNFDITYGCLSRLSFEEYRAVDKNTLGGASPDDHEQATREVAAKAHATMNDLTLLFGAPIRVRKGGRVHKNDTNAVASRYLLDARWSTPSQRVKLSSMTDWGKGELSIVTRILIAPLAATEDDD
ncbi:hypothetical protein [Polyangium jinanense]|uniref:Lipoprotein n=1 Tax=Polyangium jinanense TaxID=2829994 RepID=A0A9X4B0K9_9BACT|nr:hypothetical protein [Polyangium jinanense]MDC3989272.1 hypothetical protein [Polyangium jinanense]